MINLFIPYTLPSPSLTFFPYIIGVSSFVSFNKPHNQHHHPMRELYTFYINQTKIHKKNKNHNLNKEKIYDKQSLKCSLSSFAIYRFFLFSTLLKMRSPAHHGVRVSYISATFVPPPRQTAPKTPLNLSQSERYWLQGMGKAFYISSLLHY